MSLLTHILGDIWGDFGLFFLILQKILQILRDISVSVRWSLVAFQGQGKPWLRSPNIQGKQSLFFCCCFFMCAFSFFFYFIWKKTALQQQSVFKGKIMTGDKTHLRRNSFTRGAHLFLLEWCPPEDGGKTSSLECIHWCHGLICNLGKVNYW